MLSLQWCGLEVLEKDHGNAEGSNWVANLWCCSSIGCDLLSARHDETEARDTKSVWQSWTAELKLAIGHAWLNGKRGAMKAPQDTTSLFSARYSVAWVPNQPENDCQNKIKQVQNDANIGRLYFHMNPTCAEAVLLNMGQQWDQDSLRRAQNQLHTS